MTRVAVMDTYLTPDDLSKRYNLEVRTIRTWRFKNSKKPSPPFIKVGVTVRYPLSLLIEWENANLHVDVRRAGNAQGGPAPAAT